MSKKEVYVTQPYLPPLEEFQEYLERIWESKWLTNCGCFHQELEKKLGDYLGVEHLSLFSNGTIALIAAIQALRITGEVITTPFSFVATAHSLLWNGIRPVFVDVDPASLNLDPKKIEAAITPQTTAILPVHVYGNPCHIEQIQKIADVHGLKIIYDAAHAFGVQYRGESLLKAGDLSVLSFHATKVFNTFEGGAIVSPDAKTKMRIDFLKNFGFADEVTVMAPGINGKMSEFQAAFGLAHLKHIEEVLQRRRNIDAVYRKKLAGIKGLKFLYFNLDATVNGSYFPIFIQKDFRLTRDELYTVMKNQNILSRRYFYPLISSFPMYRGLDSANPANLPNAVAAAEQVLCLPIHTYLSDAEQDRIINIIRGDG